MACSHMLLLPARLSTLCGDGWQLCSCSLSLLHFPTASTLKAFASASRLSPPPWQHSSLCLSPLHHPLSCSNGTVYAVCEEIKSQRSKQLEFSLAVRQGLKRGADLFASLGSQTVKNGSLPAFGFFLIT